MSETATGGADASQAAKQLTRQQKAAAVVISLGAEKASQLYQYMDPEDVEQVTVYCDGVDATMMWNRSPSRLRSWAM